MKRRSFQQHLDNSFFMNCLKRSDSGIRYNFHSFGLGAEIREGLISQFF